jgi:hypothetical protein
MQNWSTDQLGKIWWIGISTVFLGAYFLIKSAPKNSLAALVVGNTGFALILLASPTEYLEWYLLASQFALMALLGDDSRIPRFLSYIIKLIFVGFPMTGIFWIKYGYLFNSIHFGIFDTLAFLMAGIVLTIVTLVIMTRENERDSTPKVDSLATAIGIVGSITIIFTLILI